MIELKDVWFRYDEDWVLKGITTKFETGKVNVVLGKNGAGKTTLLMHLNGLLKPQKGEILVDGRKVEYSKKGLIELRKKVGFVFQNPDDQIVAPTVWQDVCFGVKNVGLNESKAREALDFLGLKGYERRICSSLSGGEKRRLAIAGVIAMDPDCIVMDEPTAGLDGEGLMLVVKIVSELKREGKTLIISTHDLDFARAVGEKFFYIDNGKVIAEKDSLDYRIAAKLNLRFGFAFGKVLISKDGDGLESLLKAFEGYDVRIKRFDGIEDYLSRFPLRWEVEGD